MTTIGFIGLVLWRPLPIHDPDRIVTVGPVAAAGRAMVWAQHYALWKAQQDVFTDLAAYQFDPTAVHLVFDHGVEEVTDMDRFVRPLLVTGMLIVLIGCVSAGGIMLSVASRRARDVAIQQALGRPAGHVRRA